MSKPVSSKTSLWHALFSQRVLTYVLGVIGWIMVLYAMPFDWALPAYAEF